MALSDRLARRHAETMLYWRGHLQAQDVQDFLGVSERTARSLIARWRCVDGILPPYRPAAERRLVPVEGFDPGPAVTDPSVALSWLLTADELPGNPFAPVALPEGGRDLALSARVPSKATRELLAACLDRCPVWLLYAAKTGRQEFIFHPSAIVRSRGRYHLRGYRADGRDGDGRRLDDRYVDVVPARSVESRRAMGTFFVGLDHDVDWHTQDECWFALSSELSAEERTCYEHEYGIADTGVLDIVHGRARVLPGDERTRRGTGIRIVDRRALLEYVVQELSERRCWRRDGTSVPIWENRRPPSGLAARQEPG